MPVTFTEAINRPVFIKASGSMSLSEAAPEQFGFIPESQPTHPSDPICPSVTRSECSKLAKRRKFLCLLKNREKDDSPSCPICEPLDLNSLSASENKYLILNVKQYCNHSNLLKARRKKIRRMRMIRKKPV